tara:strand:+ start:131 stop:1012 length:882 start_codon:yes stop_codon:yes gene_type:complete
MITQQTKDLSYKKYNNFAIFGHFLSAIAMISLLADKTSLIIPYTETFTEWQNKPVNSSCSLGSRPFNTTDQNFCIATVTKPVYCDKDSCYGIDLGILIISFHILSFLFQSFAQITNCTGPILGYKYDDMIENNKNPLRFIEYSFSASIMLIAIAVLNGVTDINLISSIAVLTSACQLCGLAVEFTDNIKMKWLLHLTGWLQFGCAYGIIFHAFFRSIKSSNDNGAPGPPSFVYAIVILLFLLYSSFGIVQLFELILRDKCNRYTKEKSYVLLSLTAKLLLGWMIFSNVLVLSN